MSCAIAFIWSVGIHSYISEKKSKSPHSIASIHYRVVLHSENLSPPHFESTVVAIITLFRGKTWLENVSKIFSGNVKDK